MAANAISIIVLGLFAVLWSGCATDDLFLASKSVEEGQYEAAAETLNRCANEGDTRCDYQLAVLMLSGHLPGERDSKAASELLRKAASDGHHRAELELGRLYEFGDGVERDLGLAAEWYRSSASAGIHGAQAHLGLLYATGRGVEQDPKLAAKWYRKAAKGGDAMGQAAFGLATFRGDGVSKDVVKGYVWTKLAATQGNSQAQSNLKVMVAQMSVKELKRGRYEFAKASEKAQKKERIRTKIPIYDAKDSVRQRRSGTPGF